MKKTIWPLIILCMMALTFSPTAEAGSKSHYRWEGIAIGVGSVLFLDHFFGHYQTSPVYYPPPRYYNPAPRNYSFGYYAPRYGDHYRHSKNYRGDSRHKQWKRHGNSRQFNYSDGHQRGQGDWRHRGNSERYNRGHGQRRGYR